MNALEKLLSELKEVCAGLEDKRQGLGYRYTMTDIGLAAFSVFFLQSPSFLGHQRALAEGHGRSNCQTLLGMAAVPSDNHIRQMLDGNSPGVFDVPQGGGECGRSRRPVGVPAPGRPAADRA